MTGVLNSSIAARDAQLGLCISNCILYNCTCILTCTKSVYRPPIELVTQGLAFGLLRSCRCRNFPNVAYLLAGLNKPQQRERHQTKRLINEKTNGRERSL